MKLNYNNKDEFKKAILEQNNYSYNEIKEKINIELFWNELIYNKFKNQLKINEENLAKKIDDFENKVQKEYLLSEIVFEKKINQKLEVLIDQIKLSINEIGFDNTANIYSISNSSKIGGDIGWISESGFQKLFQKN